MVVPVKMLIIANGRGIGKTLLCIDLYVHFKVGFRYSDGNLVWGQNINANIRLTILEKKALLRLMNVKPRNFHICP